MKKLFVLAALTGVVALTSCGGNGSNAGAEAGETVDSMVNEAQGAIEAAGDSVQAAAEAAADSVKAAAESLKDNQ